MTSLSRRGFLGAASAAAVASALPFPKAAQKAVVAAGNATVKAGDTFTIAGNASAPIRWDVMWGTKSLQKFTVISAYSDAVEMELVR